jgi:beta-alanine degradation protein BauB
MMFPRFIPVVLIVAAATVAAQDPTAVSPKDYRVEVDNSWVRVLRVKQDPHEKTPMHEHPASVTVYLTDVDQRFAGQDGKTSEVRHKAGDVAYASAVERAEENLSDKPLELILIELKPGAPKPISPPITLDPVKLDPTHHLVVFENDRVRALRTILEPHLKSPMHEHPPYVVVYITGLHVTQKLGDGRLVDNPRNPGDVAWRDAQKHETENIGDRTAVEVQVELK